MIISPHTFKTKASEHNFNELIVLNGLHLWIGSINDRPSIYLTNGFNAKVVIWYYNCLKARSEDYDRLREVWLSCNG
jgi:hypothetical protein